MPNYTDPDFVAPSPLSDNFFKRAEQFAHDKELGGGFAGHLLGYPAAAFSYLFDVIDRVDDSWFGDSLHARPAVPNVSQIVSASATTPIGQLTRNTHPGTGRQEHNPGGIYHQYAWHESKAPLLNRHLLELPRFMPPKGKKKKPNKNRPKPKGKGRVRQITMNRSNKRIGIPKLRRGGGRGRQVYGPRNKNIRNNHPPIASVFSGSTGDYMHQLPISAPGCAAYTGRFRMGALHGSASGDSFSFRLTHNGSTTDTPQYHIAPYNSLYFPDQIVKLARMYQRFSIRTAVQFRPASSTAQSANFKLAHVNDPTCIYSYGTLTLNSAIPAAAFNAQSHMMETVVWKGVRIPDKGLFGPLTRDLMKFTSFPNVVGVPDTAFSYTDQDADEKVTWTYTPQAADIRDSVAGSYWLGADIQSDTIGTQDYGVFFLYYELILCDMTTSSAGFTPGFTIDISTIDLKTNTIPIPEGHALGKHLHTHYSSNCREVRGSRRPNKLSIIPKLDLPKCDECGYHKIFGRCICDAYDGLDLSAPEQKHDIPPPDVSDVPEDVVLGRIDQRSRLGLPIGHLADIFSKTSLITKKSSSAK
jgi:hypothetical protein